MSFETLLVVLLVWTVAGTLAAIAFGKAIKEVNGDDLVLLRTEKN